MYLRIPVWAWIASAAGLVLLGIAAAGLVAAIFLLAPAAAVNDSKVVGAWELEQDPDFFVVKLKADGTGKLGDRRHQIDVRWKTSGAAILVVEGTDWPEAGVPRRHFPMFYERGTDKITHDGLALRRAK